MNKLARFALITTLLVAYSPPSRSLATPTTPNVSGEGWLYGAAGYARAVELQRQLNVPLVVYFYTDWCPYCRTLDNQYLPAAPVQDYLQGVVKVRINPEHGVTERALAKRFSVSVYPAFFLMRHSAAPPVKIHPFRKVGNLTPTQFADACQANAPITRKELGVRSSGISGKFRERPEVVTKRTTTTGGTQIVTVSPQTPAPRKAGGTKP